MKLISRIAVLPVLTRQRSEDLEDGCHVESIGCGLACDALRHERTPLYAGAKCNNFGHKVVAQYVDSKKRCAPVYGRRGL